MKFILKAAASIVLTAVLLFAAAALLLKFAVSPERVKEYILPLVNAKLHREVTLEDVDINLWSGIELKGIRVSQLKKEDTFISTGLVKLKYSLLPLIKGNIVIEEVTLKQPKISIIREKNGEFNFSDLIKKEDETKTSEEASEQNQKEQNDISLMISGIHIEEAEISFIDKTLSPEAPFSYIISGVNIDCEDLSLEKPFPITMSAKLEKALLKLSAKIDPAGPGIDSHVTLKNFNIRDFEPYFVSSVPGKLSSLNLDLDLETALKAGKIKSLGRIDLSNIVFTQKDESTPLLNGERLSIVYDTKMDMEQKNVELTKVEFDLNGITCLVSGSIKDYEIKRHLNFAFNLPSQNVQDIVKALPKSVAANIGNFKPEGAVEAKASLEGPLKNGVKTLRDARLEFREIRMLSNGDKGIPLNLNGMLIFESSGLKSKALVLKAGQESEFNIDLDVDNLFQKPLKVKSIIRSSKVNLDEIAAYMEEKEVKKEENKKTDGVKSDSTSNESKEPGPLDIPVDAEGSVKADLMQFKGMDITDFIIKYHLKDNRLHVEQSSAFAGGSVSKVSDINLAVKGFAYKTDVGANSIQAAKMIEYLTSPEFKDVLTGSLNFNGVFSGKGVLPADIKKNLSAKGDWSMGKGRLAGQGLVKELALFLGLDELQTIDFDEAKGNFILDKGRLILKGLFSSNDFVMKPDGYISLDGPMDIYLNAKLSPELSESMKSDIKSIASVFKDKEGWVTLPLKISGEYMGPSFQLDKKMLKEKAATEASKQLNKLLFDNEEDNEQEKEKNGKEVINDVIKQLFK